MIEIYKYGGNVLKIKQNREQIYEYLKQRIEKGVHIFMVVSAFGKNDDTISTDLLSKNIELLENYEKDRIMSFGEIYSSLLMKSEMLKKKMNVECVNYDEIGIVCDNTYQNGNVICENLAHLSKLIKKYDLVIVPGYVAESIEGRVITLGRNTSDLTALIIANYFNIKEINIIKDVNGIYKKDPHKEGKSKLVNNISYDEAISMIQAGSSMLALKTIEYAKENNLSIKIMSIEMKEGSVISSKESEENILFINKENNKIKIVFKDMNIFNEIFKMIIKEQIQIDDMYIIKNIIYLSCENTKIYEILNKYL